LIITGLRRAASCSRNSSKAGENRRLNPTITAGLSTMRS